MGGSRACQPARPWPVARNRRCSVRGILQAGVKKQHTSPPPARPRVQSSWLYQRQQQRFLKPCHAPGSNLPGASDDAFAVGDQAAGRWQLGQRTHPASVTGMQPPWATAAAMVIERCLTAADGLPSSKRRAAGRASDCLIRALRAASDAPAVLSNSSTRSSRTRCKSTMAIAWSTPTTSTTAPWPQAGNAACYCPGPALPAVMACTSSSRALAALPHPSSCTGLPPGWSAL